MEIPVPRPSLRRLLLIGGVALSATVLLAGCSGKTASAGTTAKSDAPTIALMYGTTGDFSIMDGAFNGYTKAQKELGFKELKLASPNTDDYQDRINLAISQNADLAIGIGFQFAQPMTSTAKRGHTKFVDIDTDKDTTITDGTAVSFAANESSYLVGVAAALTSKSKHIGFVGGVDQPSIQDFFVGFEAGAKSVDKSIQVDSTYLSPLGDFTGFSNPTKGKEAAASMYSGGADVIYAAAGGSGQGVYEQAKSSSTPDKKVWAIGVDGDVYQQVDKDIKPYILTSATKNVDVAVADVIKDFEKGDLKPGQKRYDVKSGGVGYSTSGGNLDAISTQMEAAKKQIVDGVITVPTALK